MEEPPVGIPDGAAEAAAEAEILDPARLDNLRSVDATLLVDVCQLWLQTTPRMLAALMHAGRSRDVGELAVAAHALRGSSANVGAVALARACAVVEEAARAVDVERASEAVGPVVAEHDRACAAMAALLRVERPES